MSEPLKFNILDTEVYFPSRDDFNYLITNINESKNKYIVITNTHGVYLGQVTKEMRDANKFSYMCVSDSYVLNYCAYFLYGKKAEKVFLGSKIMTEICEIAEKKGNLSIGLFGSTQKNIKMLKKNLLIKYPKLNISYHYSPPFRELTLEENQTIIKDINESQVDILFVGLGCPKQEIWMLEHSKHINSLSLGVGAAFDFIAYPSKEIPNFIHFIGLGWFFRLFFSPKRLFKRYIIFGSLFIIKLLKQKINQLRI